MSQPQYGPPQLTYEAAAESSTLDIGEDGPKDIQAFSGGSRDTRQT